MSQLVQACVANDVTDLIIIHEHRGDPGIFYLITLQFIDHIFSDIGVSPYILSMLSIE